MFDEVTEKNKLAPFYMAHGVYIHCIQHLGRVEEMVFAAPRSYASAVLGVVILSVRPSVRLSHACFVSNPKNLPAIFLYHMKGQYF